MKTKEIISQALSKNISTIIKPKAINGPKNFPIIGKMPTIKPAARVIFLLIDLTQSTWPPSKQAIFKFISFLPMLLFLYSSWRDISKIIASLVKNKAENKRFNSHKGNPNITKR